MKKEVIRDGTICLGGGNEIVLCFGFDGTCTGGMKMTSGVIHNNPYIAPEDVVKLCSRAGKLEELSYYMDESSELNNAEAKELYISQTIGTHNLAKRVVVKIYPYKRFLGIILCRRPSEVITIEEFETRYPQVDWKDDED